MFISMEICVLLYCNINCGTHIVRAMHLHAYTQEKETKMYKMLLFQLYFGIEYIPVRISAWEKKDINGCKQTQSIHFNSIYIFRISMVFSTITHCTEFFPRRLKGLESYKMRKNKEI